MKHKINEMDESIEMFRWFAKNFDNLPPLLQMQYIVEVTRFEEAIKPLYVQGLMLRNDKK